MYRIAKYNNSNRHNAEKVYHSRERRLVNTDDNGVHETIRSKILTWLCYMNRRGGEIDVVTYNFYTSQGVQISNSKAR